MLQGFKTQEGSPCKGSKDKNKCKNEKGTEKVVYEKKKVR
jgi:hypothetical protein